MARLEMIPRRRAFFPMRDIFDRFLGEMIGPYFYMHEGRGWMPLTDISENKKEYIVTMEIPGVDREALDIGYADGMLRVKGEKRREIGEGESGYCTERYAGSFERSICIPGEVKAGEVDATYKEGILRVTLPKTETSEFKRIEIH